MAENAKNQVVVIGAGMGGLAAALRLAAADIPVLVIEAGQTPGGKMRQVRSGGRGLDAGPTVLTMKWVFDGLLAAFGTSLEGEVRLQKADLLARHYWQEAQSLDLFAEVAETADAIGRFAGKKDADGYIRFAADSKRIFELLKDTFIDASKPNPVSLSSRVGFHKSADLLALKPFSTLWSALGDYFSDARLRQLFGRYATYCGSSPFSAPATLMLVAHVEQAGVWIPEKGMYSVAAALADLAGRQGVNFMYGSPVEAILTDKGGKHTKAVRLASGETIPADHVLFNGDVSALQDLVQGSAQRHHPKTAPSKRSQSALVTCGLAVPDGVPLAHHTVFFSNDYEAEFRAVFKHRAAPEDPTVYICAQDRSAEGNLHGTAPPNEAERIYCLMNLPADGDRHSYTSGELDQCLTAMHRRLAANGLLLHGDRKAEVLTPPDRFNSLFPATGGALYGQASHGWMASFTRPGNRSKLKGLYLAGGSVHPGPGAPMAALSGKIAAECLIADLALTGRSRPVAINGGTSTRSATAAVTPSR
ncbi:phytoene desaturase [Roseibium denhamense]|nr:phytoene desaturase [Roseibium denhamense]